MAKNEYRFHVSSALITTIFLMKSSSYDKLSTGLLMLCLAGSATAVEKVQVLGLFKDKALLMIDGKRRLLKSGETGPEGLKLISADSKTAVIEIGGKTMSYELGNHIGIDFSPPKAEPPVQIWPTASGVYTVIGSINGNPVNFVVDTGATLIAMNRNEAKRLGIDYLVVGDESASSTANGIVRTYTVNLSRVRVGDLELTNVPAAVIDGEFPSEVLLGMSFLNRLKMERQGTVLELRKKY
jgi:aspartyl protease family protein